MTQASYFPGKLIQDIAPNQPATPVRSVSEAGGAEALAYYTIVAVWLGVISSDNNHLHQLSNVILQYTLFNNLLDSS